MGNAKLEHINITVQDPRAVALRLCQLFGWKIRWEGQSMNDGTTVHVGLDQAYVALYTHAGVGGPAGGDHYAQQAAMNHIGVVVEDLEAVEERVRAAGLEPHSHADYEPGRRFYFDDPEGIEFEVVSYAAR